MESVADDQNRTSSDKNLDISCHSQLSRPPLKPTVVLCLVRRWPESRSSTSVVCEVPCPASSPTTSTLRSSHSAQATPQPTTINPKHIITAPPNCKPSHKLHAHTLTSRQPAPTRPPLSYNPSAPAAQTSTMPSNDYSSTISGGLKLKGGAKDAGVKKKKKSSSKTKSSKAEKEASGTPDPTRAEQEEEEREGAGRESKSVEPAESSRDTAATIGGAGGSGKTDAQLRHEEIKRKRVRDESSRANNARGCLILIVHSY